MRASFHLSDSTLMLLKDFQKPFNVFLFKMHSNNSDDHGAVSLLRTAYSFYSVRAVSCALNAVSLVKNNIHDTIISQSQQFRRVAFIDTDLQESKAVKNNEALTLLGLTVLGVNLPEFLTTKCDRKAFSLTQNIKNPLGNVCYQVPHSIYSNDSSCNLFFCCFDLTVDHFFKRHHRLP